MNVDDNGGTLTLDLMLAVGQSTPVILVWAVRGGGGGSHKCLRALDVRPAYACTVRTQAAHKLDRRALRSGVPP